MPTQSLTEMVLRNAEPPETGQYVIWDKQLSGFGIRISQGGARSFVIMFYEGKRKRRMTLGKFPALGLAEARAEAKRVLANVMLGRAPEMPSTSEKVLRFSEAVTLFVDMHCAKNNRLGTAKETERLLRRHFEIKLGRMLVTDVTAGNIGSIIDGLMSTPGEANHAFSAVRTFFNWARQRRHIDRSPCEGMRLPVRPKARDRVLTEIEVCRIYDAAKSTSYPYGSIVLLLLLTGQRRQEVSGLRWSEINWEDGTITIPAGRNKSNRAHVLPIAPMALDVLKSLPRLHSNVFPARGNPNNTFSGYSKAKHRLDELCNVEDWALHDLRRTVATNLAGLGIAPHVVEKILNHSTGTISGVAAIYNRFGYQDEMREALTLWESKLGEAIGQHVQRKQSTPVVTVRRTVAGAASTR